MPQDGSDTTDHGHELVVTSKEITAGSPEIYQPASFDEWERQKRSETILKTWSTQMGHERDLRAKCAGWVFGLVLLQVIVTFGIIIAQGVGWLHLDNELIKILIPTEAAEILGLALIVIKYLFSQEARSGLDDLVKKDSRDAP